MILLLISFAAGLLTVLAPCVLPLLPVIVGGSVRGGGRSYRRALTVTFALALSVVLFTLLIKASTVFIAIPQLFWKLFSGGIVLLFGLVTLFPGVWDKIPYMARASVGSNKLLGSGYTRHDVWGDVIVGAALGPVFSTCSPTYFLVLATVLPQHFFVGLVYLISYAVGLSAALLFISFVGQRLLEKIGTLADPHSIFKKVLGGVFLVVGIAIISGADKQFETFLLNAGIFDITKVEQQLLRFAPAPTSVTAPLQAPLGENAGSTTTAGAAPQSIAEKIKSRVSAALDTRVKAPEISTPDGFINTDGKPLTLASLRGKVVLLDVWTYSCINCQRTLPHINALYAKYKDQGFVVVGLHTPEFAFEHIQKNVEDAVVQFDIKYPVVLDNDYSTWNAYGNQYWPRQYLIDQDGYIVYDHIGEGGYEETEMAIQAALERGVQNKTSVASTTPLLSIPVPTIDAASPETYFGAARNEFLANGTPGKVGTLTFAIPPQVNANQLYLGGVWNIKNEFAESAGKDSIVFRYTAKGVYIVAGSAEGTTLSVYKDDVLVKKVTVTNETLYHLVDDDAAATHTLRVECDSKDLQVFTFTFG